MRDWMFISRNEFGLFYFSQNPLVSVLYSTVRRGYFVCIVDRNNVNLSFYYVDKHLSDSRAGKEVRKLFTFIFFIYSRYSQHKLQD